MTKRMTNRSVLCTTFGAAMLCGTGLANGSDLAYEHSFQSRVGAEALFNTAGPATQSSPDVQGDAFLTSVNYPNGDEFIHYYRPTEVFGLQYVGNPRHIQVRGGTNITMGVSGGHKLGNGKTSTSALTTSDYEDFQSLMLQALRNSNLNTYIDLSSSGGPQFSFMMRFERPVIDNDSGSDDFGEILYFERGSGSGNSWLKMRAVDADGNALGPWLVIGPNETVQTTPKASIYNSNQSMGVTSIDVSRLGVKQFEYLEVSNDMSGESAYSGGGDTAPDFKIMVVMTNEDQMNDVIFD